jgi:hypothetical protein
MLVSELICHLYYATVADVEGLDAGRGQRAASWVQMAASIGRWGQGVYNNMADIVWWALLLRKQTRLWMRHKLTIGKVWITKRLILLKVSFIVVQTNKIMNEAQ